MDLTIQEKEQKTMKVVEKNDLEIKELSRWPEPIIDPQDQEEKEMRNLEFMQKLHNLDEVLERIPKQEYELKIYIIETVLMDDSDPENIAIVDAGKEKFGPIEKYYNE